MSRYFRFAYEQVLPAYLGVDTDTAPFALHKARAPVARNFLTDRPAVMTMRGPLATAASVATISGNSGMLPPVALLGTNSVLAWAGSRASSSTATREPWVAPYRPVTSSAQLAGAVTGSNNANQFNLTSWSNGTTVTIPQTQVPRGRATVLLGNGYFVAYDCAGSTTTLNGIIYPLCKLVRIAPSGTLTNVATFGGAQDVRAHLQRVWLLGGTDKGGANFSQNTLYWSDPQASDLSLAASWTDNVTGLDNKIVIDSDDQTDFGVALARIGSNLAIFKRRSIHMLRGYSTATFAVRPFTQEQGCLDPRSIVEHDDGCFFVSQQGFMWFDGSRLVNYTPDLKTSFLQSVLSRVGDQGIDGGFVTAMKLPNNYLMVSVGVQNPNTGAVTIDFCGMFSVTARAWSTFSSTLLSGTGPTILARPAGFPFLSDGVNNWRADVLTLPEQASASARGFDVNASGTKARIPARFQSRLAAMGSPLHGDQIHRITFDYAFRQAGGSDEAAWVSGATRSGWFFSVINSSGQTLWPQTQVPALGDPGIYPYRRQVTFDALTETIDAQVIVEWKDDGSNTYPPIKQADIHQTIFEFYPSSGQRQQ